MSDYRERSPNTFAHEVIDRVGEQRGDLKALAASHPRVRIVPVWRSRTLVSGDPENLKAIFLNDAALIDDQAVFLGVGHSHRYYAIDLSAQETRPFADLGEYLDLRMVGQLLSEHDAAVLAQARGMCTWHRRHSFCGKCGAATVSEHAGHQRRCSNTGCEHVQFPRTDPAIIVQVSRGDRILLGRQASWPEGSWSVVAGFVEPGESLEGAVRREVMEETGIEVENVRYHSSQPWPFPQSIMLGFCADAVSEDIDLKDGELEQARWFSRDELDRLVKAREIRLSRPISISHRLIADWRAQGNS